MMHVLIQETATSKRASNMQHEQWVYMHNGGMVQRTMQLNMKHHLNSHLTLVMLDSA